MPSINYTLERDEEEIDLVIDYEVSKYYPGRYSGPPEDCYPPEGGEITSFIVTHNDDLFDVSQEEIEKIEAFIYDNHNYDEDGRDPDYEYDD